jgi:hypothetical protein
MSSRPPALALLIGVVRAMPCPNSPSSNTTQDTWVPNAQILATDGNTGGHFRLVALPSASTVDLTGLVTPISQSSETDPADTATHAGPSSISTTPFDLTEITPVPVSTSSPPTVVTGQHVHTHTITDWVTVTLLVPPLTGRHTHTITDWVTVTLSKPRQTVSATGTVA